MTAQMMDQCVYDGATWCVCSMPSGMRPSSESLGIRTSMEHTANWSGRVDTYVIADDRVMLQSVRATHLDITSDFAGEVVATEGMNSIVRFDLDRRVSGWLVLGRSLDPSRYVHGGYQTANRFRERVWLRLDGGVVLEARHEHGAYADAPAPPISPAGRAGCAALASAPLAVLLPLPLGWKIAIVLVVTLVAFLAPRRPPPPGPTVF